MGPTLASFATEEAANGFMMEHGGEVLKYSAITMEHLNTGMAKHGMDGMDGMDH
jgi:copper chaperone NosL